MPFDGLRPYLDTLERKNLFKWVEREVVKQNLAFLCPPHD